MTLEFDIHAFAHYVLNCIAAAYSGASFPVDMLKVNVPGKEKGSITRSEILVFRKPESRP